MRVPHTKKLILALALLSCQMPLAQAFINDIDLPAGTGTVSYLDLAKFPVQLAIEGAKFVHNKANKFYRPIGDARKYFIDVAQGAKVGSMRAYSQNHWLSTAIEPLAQIHGLGWLRHVSFLARRGPDMLHLFVNEQLTLEQKAMALALGILEPIGNKTGIGKIQEASSSLRNQLGLDPKDVIGNNNLSWMQKLIIMALHLTKYRSFEGDSSGLQYGLEQMIESFIHYGVYSYRGNTNVFDNEKWKVLKASPKFQRGANRLFYSLFTEVGIVQHTDFIFSIIAEEVGLVGSGTIVLLYVLFCYYGLRIATGLRDPFSLFVTLAYTLLITLQAVINLMVVTGMVPTKGLGLPFISYGGSALMVCWCMLGVIANCVREQR